MNEITPPPRWTIFARGEDKDDRIARCPGGHIHLDYGNLTIRFHDDEFIAFARMVVKAAARMGEATQFPMTIPRALASKATFSLN